MRSLNRFLSFVHLADSVKKEEDCSAQQSLQLQLGGKSAHCYLNSWRLLAHISFSKFDTCIPGSATIYASVNVQLLTYLVVDMQLLPGVDVSSLTAVDVKYLACLCPGQCTCVCARQSTYRCTCNIAHMRM